jgi:hypothetical protein
MISMKRFRGAMVAGALALALAAPSALAQDDVESRAEVSKQVAIMSRVLEKTLADELRGQVITSSMFQRGVQGFYSPGTGAFFFADVKFPVAQPPEKKPEAEKPVSDDLWDRFESEIEREPQPDVSHQANRLPGQYGLIEILESKREVDTKKIARLKETIFEALAHYGRRLEAVRDEERIVVIVSGGRPGSSVIYGTSTGVSFGEAVTPRLVEKTVYAGPEISGVVSSGVNDSSAPGGPMTFLMVDPPLDPAVLSMKAGGIEQGKTESSIYQPTQAVSAISVATPDVTFGPMGGGQSVLTIVVRKNDLVDNPKDLAERATIESYCSEMSLSGVTPMLGKGLGGRD